VDLPRYDRELRKCRGAGRSQVDNHPKSSLVPGLNGPATRTRDIQGAKLEKTEDGELEMPGHAVHVKINIPRSLRLAALGDGGIFVYSGGKGRQVLGEKDKWCHEEGKKADVEAKPQRSEGKTGRKAILIAAG